MKIAFISTFDSFVRANHILKSALAEHGVVGDEIVMKMRVDQIQDRQIRSIIGREADHVLDLEQTLELLRKQSYDWVFLGLENASCRRFFVGFRQIEFAGRRPLVAVHYPGIIFRHHYDGFSARMPADLVILNSRSDKRRYLKLRETFGDFSDNAFDLGPTTIVGCDRFKFAEGRNKVIFFDQPSVPHTKEEKTYIFQQLARLAVKHPELDFRVKLRVKPNDSTLHKGGQATLEILNDFNASLPAGSKHLGLIDGTPRALIAESVLGLSVSSTALIEAMACGCPAVAIGDFGIDEEYGASFFVESGIIGMLENLDPANPPVVNDEWVAEHISNSDSRLLDLHSTLVAKLKAHAGEAVPPGEIHPYYGAEAFYKTAVERFGFRSTLSRRYRRQKFIVRYVVQFVSRRMYMTFSSWKNFVSRRGK